MVPFFRFSKLQLLLPLVISTTLLCVLRLQLSKKEEPIKSYRTPPFLQNTTSRTKAIFPCDTNKPITEDPSLLLKYPSTAAERTHIKSVGVHFRSYGNAHFAQSVQRIAKEAREFGRFTSVHVCTPKNLPSTFVKEFAPLFQYGRGGGYWIWKCYLILKELKAIPDNDFLVYVDAGSTIDIRGRDRFQQYLLMLHRSKSGFLSISLSGALERRWNPGRVLEAFGASEKKDFLNSSQYVSGFLVMRKQVSVVLLFQQILEMVRQDMWIITDAYGDYRKPKSFSENRHDQSLLSLARKCTGSVPVLDFARSNGKNVPFMATRIRK